MWWCQWWVSNYWRHFRWKDTGENSWQFDDCRLGRIRISWNNHITVNLTLYSSRCFVFTTIDVRVWLSHNELLAWKVNDASSVMKIGFSQIDKWTDIVKNRKKNRNVGVVLYFRGKWVIKFHFIQLISHLLVLTPTCECI